MKTKLLTMITALSVAVLLSSCGKVPQAEIDAANAAIEAAKTAGADVYLSDDYTALQDSMRSINQKVEEQNGKMFKNYNDITAQLATVNEMAAEVQEKTAVRKEEIKAEIEGLQAEVSAIIAQNNELIAQAPKGKEGAAALEAIKSDNAIVETTVNEVANQVAEDQLMPALNKVKAAKEKAVALNTELNDAVAKFSKSKKK